jgi:dolichol-phosphate mannosyltransferase
MTASEGQRRDQADGVNCRWRGHGPRLRAPNHPLDDDADRRVQRDDVFVVVPTFNEAENLEKVAAAVLAVGFRLLVVDDASPDGTGEIADELAADDRVHVLHRPTKDGLGPAYAAGFAWAFEHNAGILCEMDADFSHNPSDLPRLVAAVDAGADVAIGSRYTRGGRVEDWPLRRRLLSRGGNMYANLMLGAGLSDMTSGSRAFRASALRSLRPDTCRSSGYGFQIEMAWRARRRGLEVVEVPITFRDRQAGTSKMSTGIAVEVIRLVTRWGAGRLVGLTPDIDGPE